MESNGDGILRYGALVFGLARRAVEEAVSPRAGQRGLDGPAPSLPPLFEEPRGVFVTLKRFPSGSLRGCVGYPLPIYPLRTGLPRAAVAAATEDPRFPPVHPAELGRLTIEVSVLTLPEVVRGTPGSIAETVRVGRDGLIVDGYGTSGLLLPQVAPEMGWSSEEFLDGVCEKAGLPGGAWRDPRVTVRRFEATVLAESSPAGPLEPEGPSLTRGERPSPRS